MSDAPVSNAERNRPIKELSRRAASIAATCGRDGRYRICVLCGARIYFNRIAYHLRKHHADELMAMPAERFK